jgi:hypothetical protein
MSSSSHGRRTRPTGPAPLVTGLKSGRNPACDAEALAAVLGTPAEDVVVRESAGSHVGRCRPAFITSAPAGLG